jgi:bacteriocin biosynthesis cyclodehydratase domain-containing protein
MTVDDPTWHSHTARLSGQHGTGEIRFSPNFSVYIVPPDGVCLYAENRKVFLRGELYCAIAARIGAGERPEAIVNALSAGFPPGKIDEAIKRLLDRRFVVPVNLIDETAAGYWASFGLTDETAVENLRNTSVQIESMGAAGQGELDAALRKFGVRVVDHSANLTVVLVDDYLDSQLVEFSRQRLTQKQEWLLVQPSGIFPLVGPIFSPGKSACWTCLADRMKGNRQIKAFLDRKNARCVVASPLSKNLLAPSAIGLAATEIAKAVASGFRTDLHHNVVSLDLLGSMVVRHHVSPRPQCPSCGSKDVRDPDRAPLPIRLRVGGKAVMTSGGYRSVAPAETVARFRKHVSPVTGIVSQLERMKSEQPLDFTFRARHSFSPRPESVNALQVQLIGDSYGKGNTADQAEASALMKAVERYCGIFQGDEIRTTRRFVDFPAGDAILPNDILLLSDTQYGRGPDAAAYSGAGRPRPFDPSVETEWSPVWSLRDECFKHLPTDLLYFFHDASAKNQFNAASSGCAAGNTLEEAILQGFLELVERDAYSIWWYNRLQRAEIDLDRLGDSYIRDLRAQFAGMGRGLWVLDVTSDLDIPVVMAVSHWKEDGRECIEFAAGAHFDLRVAALRAVTGLNQFLAVDRMTPRATAPTVADSGDALPVPLRKHAYVLPHGKAIARGARSAKFADLDRREQVLACVKLAKRLGLDFLVLDQTRPDVQVPVVRVIVPGLRHVYRRFAPGRLYDVPVKLGLRKRPLREADLNPLHPRTLEFRSDRPAPS